jgi:hypothetical protein
MTSRRWARVTALLIVMALPIAGASRARAESTAEVQSGSGAAELFRQAREAMKSGEYRAACAAFEASQRLDPSAGTLLNIAVCSEKLGRLRRARTALEEFIGQAEQGDSRRPHVVALLADIKERTPHLHLRISDPTPVETKVLVDGDEIAPNVWRAPLALDPGHHVLEVRTPGRTEQRRSFEIRERESLTETFVFSVAEKPRTEFRTVRPRRSQRELPTIFYLSLGIGVGGLVTAAGTGLFVMRQHATVDEHCANKRCDAEGLAAGDLGIRYATISTIALPIGVAGTALASYVWFTTKNDDSGARVGAVIGSSRAAVTVRGNF